MIGWWVEGAPCDKGGKHEYVDVSEQECAGTRWELAVRCVKCRGFACITETGLRLLREEAAA